MRDRIFLILAGPLAFITPVLASLASSHISVTAPASRIVWGGAAALGLIFGILAAIAKPTERSGRLRSVLFVLVLAAAAVSFADVIIGWRWLWINVFGEQERLSKLLIISAFALVAAAAFWFVRKAAAIMLFAGAAAFCASQIASMYFADNSARAFEQTKSAERKPPFVYILLDEAEGINGIRHAPGGNLLADRLTRMFEEHGFRLYNRSFSRHYYSARSIPNILNFDFTDDSWGPILRYQKDLQVSSALFQKLQDDGYEVDVYATTHESLNFCFPVAAKCRMLESFNPMSEYLSGLDIQLSAILNAASKVYNGSYLLGRYMDQLFLRYDVAKTQTQTLDSYAFPRWFDAVTDEIQADGRGHATFFHVLFPHSPYVRAADCSLQPPPKMGYFLAEEQAMKPEEIEPAREERYRHYVAQYHCLAEHLDRFLTEIDANADFQDATIVVSGDHGARISSGRYAENINERDMISNFSALYAIRVPGIEPGVDDRKVAVQRLTAEFFSGKSPAELGPEPMHVVIDKSKDREIEIRSMPDF